MLVAGTVAVAVPATVAVLGRPDLARAALPFVALLPGAVWMGVSADAMFAGVVAAGIATLAVGATRLTAGRSAGGALCAAAGVVLGFGIFLSYGLLLMAPVALAVIIVTRCWRALLYAVPAALAVAGVFALAGFWWLDGYHLVVERYYAGIAAHRPYWYWVWANLACLALAVGPAAVAGLRRTVPHFLEGLPRRPAARSGRRARARRGARGAHRGPHRTLEGGDRAYLATVRGVAGAGRGDAAPGVAALVAGRAGRDRAGGQPRVADELVNRHDFVRCWWSTTT